MDFKQKYLKYKKKYLDLKNKLGGVLPDGLLRPIIPMYDFGKSTKIIVKAHGTMLGSQYSIPAGVNIINLSALEDGIIMDERIDQRLLEFYEAGNVIFDNDDKTNVKTAAGSGVEGQLREADPRINIRNHVGPMLVNDMYLDFENKCPGAACTLDIIKNFIPGTSKPADTKNLKIPYTFGPPPRSENIKNILLSDLINLILGGDGINPPAAGSNITIIVRACRVVDPEIPKPSKEAMRLASSGV